MSVIVQPDAGHARLAHRLLWWWLPVAAALAFGTFLRGWQLRSQMLVDDEWHAVRMLLGADFGTIATHFGHADHSIPLTLLYRWMYRHGTLDEWHMHVPLLFAGLALLVLAAIALRRELRPATRTAWVALLALSPALVYFSRTARPYALVALCGFAAILAFRAWWLRRPHAGWCAAAYVACTALAAWAHLLSLLFTLWPFVHFGAIALLRQRRELPRLVLLAAATALPLLALLAPPLVHDWASMASKAGTDLPAPQTLLRAVLMQFGTGSVAVGALLAMVAGAGAWRLRRTLPHLVALPLGAALFGLLAICIARPAWIQHAPVLVRYAAPFLPFLLLYLAAGIAALCERAGRLAWLPMLAVLGGLFVLGPLPAQLRHPNGFTGHALYQFDYDPAHNPYASGTRLGEVPAFYRELARRAPASVTLVEAPQRAHSNYMPQPWLQAIHRQNVKFALVGAVCGEGDWDELPPVADPLPLRRMARLADILDGATWGADFLVLRMRPWTTPPGDAFPWPVTWPDMAACAVKVEVRLGAPAYADAQIRVYDLRRDR